METAQKKQFLKIIVLGDANVGKTSILQRYVTASDPGYTKPTLGADFTKKEVVVNDQFVTVNIWDTAGQEQFHSVSMSYYRGADCCVLVFDITKKGSFESLKNWRKKFIEATGCTVEDFPFVVMGNKCDREAERDVSKEDAEAWCKENGGIPYFESSAQLNIGVEDAFMSIIK